MLRITLNAPEAGFSPLPGLPDWPARLLYARGVRGEDAARAFLNPSWDQILPPETLPGVREAVAILKKAKALGWRAAVYGDYDVDGVCASAILSEALAGWGLAVRTYIPDRHTEGYGLNLAAVEDLARDCRLLITVDCGITGMAEVARAKELGMAVIVTDHHTVGEALPPADAVVSPLLNDYPFSFLCGAGVAWKLALALLGEGGKKYLELAALATVADLVPLTGENRSMVYLGLQMLPDTKRPGLRALMEEAGIQGRVSSDQVAFQLAPRLNACGRMASAGAALELLRTKDRERARALALEAENLNRQRKEEEALVIAESEAQIGEMDLSRFRGIVTLGENWNSGVVGLAAGRMAEKYCCPAVALARTADVCVGSARSAGNVNLYAALSACADLFTRFGGHRQAAGLTLPAANVPAFRERFSAAVARQTGDRPLVPETVCDGELALSQVTPETAALLSRLEPFGMGNPAPRFLCRNAQALSLRAVGAEGRHLKCTFRQENALRDGIFFGGGDWAKRPADSYNLVMTPTVQEYRGRVTAECRIFAMEIAADALKPDAGRAAQAYLSDFAAESDAPEIALDALPAAPQGMLLVCRCVDTALALHRRFPDFDFALTEAGDRRGFSTVLLYGAANKACASFRQVVLCDGDGESAAAWRRACPAAEISRLPRTDALEALLRKMRLDRDELRACYRAFRQAPPRDAADFAAQAGLSPAQAAFALRVFVDIGLITEAGDRYALLPMQKRGPEESPLFQRAWRA